MGLSQQKGSAKALARKDEFHESPITRKDKFHESHYFISSNERSRCVPSATGNRSHLLSRTVSQNSRRYCCNRRCKSRSCFSIYGVRHGRRQTRVHRSHYGT